jgi:hypothetical protein
MNRQRPANNVIIGDDEQTWETSSLRNLEDAKARPARSSMNDRNTNL